MLSFRILNKEALEITTMACLLVAVKLEEKDLQLVNALLTWFEEPWTTQLKQMELYVCDKLGWNLIPIAPIEVIEFVGLQLNDL